MRNAILIGVSRAPDFGSLQLLPTKTALLGCLLPLLLHLVVLLMRHLLLLLRYLLLLLGYLLLLLGYLLLLLGYLLLLLGYLLLLGRCLFAVLSWEARVGLRVFDGA